MQIQRGAVLIEHFRKNFKVNKRKDTITIIFHENKFAHAQEHFKANNILNIYQLNISNNLFLLSRVKKGKAPKFFSLNS